MKAELSRKAKVKYCRHLWFKWIIQHCGGEIPCLAPHCKDLQVLTGTYRHVLLTGIENPCCKFYLLDKSFDKQLQLLLKHVSLTGKFENLLNWQGSPVSGDVS